MRFTVKYRTSSSAIQSEVAESASRSAVLSEYRQRGVSIISVMEGGVSPHKSTKENSTKIILGIVLCAVIVAAAWWFLSPSDQSGTSKRDKDATQACSSGLSNKPNGHANTSVAGPKKSGKLSHDKHGMGRGHSQIPTNIDSVAVESSVSNGLVTAETNSVVTPRPVFTNVSDQLLAMVATAGSGDVPPIPFSEDMEKQFLDSLNTPIEILATDDAKVKELKQAVIDMRAEVKQMLEQGQTLRQILSEHQKLARQNSEIRRSALLELKGIIASGDIAGAVEYKRKINVALGQMGIAELKIPVTDEDYEEIARAKEQRKLERSMKKEQERK